MAYDLVIGKSALVRDSPIIAGSMEFGEQTLLQKVYKYNPNWFIGRISNQFEDESFSLSELEEAATIVDDLIIKIEDSPEREVLYKLGAIVSMALRKQQPLHGVSD